jgi:hypothetical protein
MSLIVVQPITCFSLEIRRVQTCSGPILRLRGDIKAGDFSQLKSHFRGKEVIIGFDLSSLGGDLEDGLRIANLTRRKKLTVYVAGECSSACADVFIAAARRFFGEESKIGVHAVSNNRDTEDAGVSRKSFCIRSGKVDRDTTSTGTKLRGSIGCRPRRETRVGTCPIEIA